MSDTPAPAVVNLEAWQGAFWTRTLLWKDATDTPVDLTGYTARMQVRRGFSPNDDVLLLLETNPKPGGGTGNGRITLGLVADPNPPNDPLYNILFEVDAVTMAALPAQLGDYIWVYDLELVPSGGQVRRLIQGQFKVSLEVTR